MKPFQFFRSLGSLSILAVALSAQSIDNDFGLNFGNTDLGGRVEFGAIANTQLQATGARVELGANARARLRMFGRNMEVASATASWSASATQLFGGSVVRAASKTLQVRLVGLLLINDTDGQAVGNLPPIDVFGPTGLAAPIPVGPVVITVSCNAGVSSNFSISGSANASTMSVSLSGSVNAAANGVARVGVGVPGAQVGVSATLRFADTTATLNLGATRSGPNGSFSISMRPIRLLLALFAEIPLVPRINYTFYDYALPAQTRNFTLF